MLYAVNLEVQLLAFPEILQRGLEEGIKKIKSIFITILGAVPAK